MKTINLYLLFWVGLFIIYVNLLIFNHRHLISIYTDTAPADGRNRNYFVEKSQLTAKLHYK